LFDIWAVNVVSQPILYAFKNNLKINWVNPLFIGVAALSLTLETRHKASIKNSTS